MSQRVLGFLAKSQHRFISTTANYITTPIFYVNAKPHLGHFYSMTLADVQNRWTKFNDRETFFTTGTDEHGLKVQNAAAKKNIDPKLFCDDLSDKFKDLAKLGNIEYDRFIRTTDPDHLDAVNYFWQLVWDKGYIYKGEHSGWYSISDEAFYPEVDIEEVIDAKTGEKKMVSKETGSEVNFEKEENYFFKLSAFQDQLIEFLEKNPDFIQPTQYYNAVLKELKTNPLSDLSISRPSWRLQWGITVPNDETQKIYVWFDALLNYYTSLGYPNIPPVELTPATHLIGKDIVRFHCIHWPIFLMAAGLPTPKRVVVHGHWLMAGSKMSKSKGNVADPVEIADYYGVDALRLFIMRYSVLDNDCDFSEEKLNNTRTEFIDKFCNLLTRSLSKNFSITRALQRLESNHATELLKFAKDEELAKDLNQLYQRVNSLHAEIDPYVTNLEMHKAIQIIWSVLPQINGLFDKYKPWTLKVKPEDDELQAASKLLRQDLIIFSALDSLRCILILLQSFIPDYSKLLLDRLNVLPKMRTYEHTKISSDLSYGENAVWKKGEKVPLQRLELQEK
ncbi:unnamed protein product [Ambrosiozyma monospora]|uniref:Methionine--tRNA ligase, mitochondrial n=1 Tax=Ambrosiozyma monospora TaxID=43982 RepID=A0A9W7DFA7_AMBMO|nr:unnamed protein product [Ambrosiozyma monospora]